jgi:hypothetical protein
MDLTEDQENGLACVSCGRQGRAEEGQIVGTVHDTGVQVWACYGGCTVVASWGVR